MTQYAKWGERQWRGVNGFARLVYVFSVEGLALFLLCLSVGRI